MPAVPTNVRTVQADYDGVYVKIAWDDATDPATVQEYRFYPPGSPYQAQVSYDRAARTAMIACSGGTARSLEMSVKASNSESPRTAPFTITPQTSVLLSQLAHLRAALPGVTVDVGDDVLIAAPSVGRRVQPDGTIQ